MMPRAFRYWTEEEELFIRVHYRHTMASLVWIGERLDRSWQSVKGAVACLGLAHRQDRHPWSDKEDEQVTDLILRYSVRKVAKMMHRSINSVVLRSKRLGIHRRYRNGWYTKKDVCELIARDHKWLQRRIDSGALKASYHHDQRPSNLGGAYWHIDEKDLANFIRSYPEELAGRNIDIISIIHMLTPSG